MDYRNEKHKITFEEAIRKKDNGVFFMNRILSELYGDFISASKI